MQLFLWYNLFEVRALHVIFVAEVVFNVGVVISG